MRSRCNTISASIDPERVAIGTPSSGLKPIVVSTERPSRTAVTEQPPPRWQTTSRGTRTCSAAHCTERPWKPKRRMPHRRATGPAARTSTPRPDRRGETRCRTRRRAGRRGSARLASSIAATPARLCSGASSASSVECGRDLGVDDDRLAEARACRGRRDGRPHRRRRPRSKESIGREIVRLVDDRELEARRAGVDDEDRLTRRAARPSRESPGRPRRARACTRGRAAARPPSPGGAARRVRPSPGTRSMTSMTRWNRSRSFSITMSNGVVVVPSSL